jgi:hypothetical protein
MTLAIIGPAEPIADGTSVLCVWPTGTPLPSSDTLKTAVSPFGIPFELSYLDREHVGVKIQDQAPDSAIPLSTRLGGALMGATAGHAPIMLAVPSR